MYSNIFISIENLLASCSHLTNIAQFCMMCMPLLRLVYIRPEAPHTCACVIAQI